MIRLHVIGMLFGALLTAPFLTSEGHSGIIYGSGFNQNPSQEGQQRDDYWKIVAGPSYFVPPDGQSYPYAAYVSDQILGLFYGANGPPGFSFYDQNGYFDPNTGHVSYWIAPSPNNTSSIGQDPQSGQYNWIAAQDFYVDSAGTYDFIFPISGDNEITFYIDGSIDYSNPDFPVIINGTQIGGSWNDFANIGFIQGSVFLNIGTHTAYMKLYDFGGETGALIGTASFTNIAPVPEPGTLAVFAGLALCGTMRRWKKSRRLE